MISSVRNSASVVMTCVGGRFCVPIACRNRLSTTTMRTKQVVISSTAGARLSTVSSSITCSVELSPSGLVQAFGPAVEPFGKPHRQRLIGRAAARRPDRAQAQRPSTRGEGVRQTQPEPAQAERDREQPPALAHCIRDVSHRVSPLPKHLAKGRRGAARVGLPAQAGQPIDLGGVGDFGQRLRPGGRDGDQQQLVAAAEQVDLLAVGQGGAAEHLERLGRQGSQPAGRRPAKHPHDQKEDSQAPRPGCRRR